MPSRFRPIAILLAAAACLLPLAWWSWAGAADTVFNPGNIRVGGNVTVGGTLTAAAYSGIARTSLDQEDNAEVAVPLTAMRVHDSLATNLPATSSADDMALITGTPGTDAPTLQGVDFGGTTSDEKCSFQFTVPPDYVDGQTLMVVVRASMVTSVADTSATVDVECWPQDDNGAASADICATAAQSINSLTPADKTFSLTTTSVSRGDVLTIRLSFAGTDVANAAVLIPEIQKVTVLCDQKG